jgi:hypothetical protein
MADVKDSQPSTLEDIARKVAEDPTLEELRKATLEERRVEYRAQLVRLREDGDRMRAAENWEAVVKLEQLYSQLLGVPDDLPNLIDTPTDDDIEGMLAVCKAWVNGHAWTREAAKDLRKAEAERDKLCEEHNFGDAYQYIEAFSVCDAHVTMCQERLAATVLVLRAGFAEAVPKKRVDVAPTQEE